MKPEDITKFNYLNNTSYLFRLNLIRNGFDIVKNVILNDEIWYVSYKERIIGIITFRVTDTYTYCNLRPYEHLKKKYGLKDFIMSEYFDFEDDKPIRFNFDKFDKFFAKYKEVETEPVEETESTEETRLDESISRLKEYCEAFDEKFSKNMLFNDIRILMDAYYKEKEKNNLTIPEINNTGGNDETERERQSSEVDADLQ